MHGEVPEFKRCCFCVPLRRGLIGWGYTKVILNMLMILFLASIIYFYAFKSKRSLEATNIAILVFISICLLIDISLNIIFIVAGHKKSVKLLKITYIYNIVWMGLVTLGNCFQLYTTISAAYGMWTYIEYRKYIVLDLLISSGFVFTIIFVQLYLILLIRSEMVKLQHQALEVQFTNHAASGEPQCTLNYTFDTDKTQVIQDTKQAVHECCTDKKQTVQQCLHEPQ